MADKMKLGNGGRFAVLKAKLSHKPGVTNAGALAAAIGRKKYGTEKMASMSAKGRVRHQSERSAPAVNPKHVAEKNKSNFMAMLKAKRASSNG